MAIVKFKMIKSAPDSANKMLSEAQHTGGQAPQPLRRGVHIHNFAALDIFAIPMPLIIPQVDFTDNLEHHSTPWIGDVLDLYPY